MPSYAGLPGHGRLSQDRLDLRHPGEHARAGIVVGDVLRDGGDQFEIVVLFK